MIKRNNTEGDITYVAFHLFFARESIMYYIGIVRRQKNNMHILVTSLIKLIEFLTAVVITCIHYKIYDAVEVPQLSFLTCVFTGYTYILFWLVLGYVIKVPFNKLADRFFCFTGGLIYLVCGTIILIYFMDKKPACTTQVEIKEGIANAALALVLGLVLLIDVCLVPKGINERIAPKL